MMDDILFMTKLNSMQYSLKQQRPPKTKTFHQSSESTANGPTQPLEINAKLVGMNSFRPMPHQSRVQWHIMNVPIIPKPGPNPLVDPSQYAIGSRTAQRLVTTSQSNSILSQYPELIRSKHLLCPLTRVPSMNDNFHRSIIYMWPEFQDDSEIPFETNQDKE